MTKHSSKSKENKTEEVVEETVVDVNAETQVEETVAEEVVVEEEISETEQLTRKLEEVNDKYLRLSAEFDNYRRRTLKEKMELTKSAGTSLLLGLLPVADDFDRALDHLDDAKDTEAIKAGIKLIYNKFNEFLGAQGLKVIEAKEKEFDTDLHEAITKIPAPKPAMKGKVIDCVEKGYTLNDKVIRFSKVVVGE